MYRKIALAAVLVVAMTVGIKQAKAIDLDGAVEENAVVIGCINSKTYETRYPNRNGNCYYGNGWQNLMLPPKSQLETWREVFGSDEMIVNRLPIVNFESGFDENASNKFAKGYVQTLRSYGIPPDAKSQLEWMRDRQESQKKGNCSQWAGNDERLVRCLYARHYGATDGFDWYPSKLMAARSFYISYLNK